MLTYSSVSESHCPRQRKEQQYKERVHTIQLVAVDARVPLTPFRFQSCLVVHFYRVGREVRPVLRSNQDGTC